VAKLTTKERADLPAKDFGGPDRSFPMEDADHARDAISGAVHAWHAGHITDEEAKRIIAEARTKLAEYDGKRDAKS
jgi:hypothetical protein